MKKNTKTTTATKTATPKALPFPKGVADALLTITTDLYWFQSWFSHFISDAIRCGYAAGQNRVYTSESLEMIADLNGAFSSLFLYAAESRINNDKWIYSDKGMAASDTLLDIFCGDMQDLAIFENQQKYRDLIKLMADTTAIYSNIGQKHQHSAEYCARVYSYAYGLCSLIWEVHLWLRHKSKA